MTKIMAEIEEHERAKLWDAYLSGKPMQEHMGGIWHDLPVYEEGYTDFEGFSMALAYRVKPEQQEAG